MSNETLRCFFSVYFHFNLIAFFFDEYYSALRCQIAQKRTISVRSSVQIYRIPFRTCLQVQRGRSDCALVRHERSGLLES